MLSDGTITPGNLIKFLFYAKYVADALKDLSIFYSNFSTATAACQKIEEVMEPTLATDSSFSTDRTLDKLESIDVVGNIRFHSVSFAYPSRPKINVLDNINMDIPAGKVFAIFGASGSGKSTLAALILRLYDLEGLQIW